MSPAWRPSCPDESSYVRRLLAILLPGLLLLTACGGGDKAAPEPTSQSAGETAKLDSLKLTDNGDKKAPGVDFAKPLEVKEFTAKVITEGSGEKLSANQIATVSVAGFNATDGKALGDNFGKDPEQLELSDALKSGNPVMYGVFVGAKVGSQIALVAPGQPATEGTAAQPAQLYIARIMGVKEAPKPLSQDETEQLDKAGKLPKITFDDKGIPSASIPKTDAPSGLSVKVLSEGSGEKVAATDTIEANYTGWRWEDGKEFESTFGKNQPATFPLTGVIKGWTMGLTDQKVGSKVLLTIPSDLAYGADAAAQGKPAGPLVFVVEIKSKK
ncbi:FKBP-type peptidyl-prolyl cis-trans isomerase [Arthrobacter sp. NPDC080086]|uniref:FKBP-type peptidyl-prolyl cis-trans isomerase n=1 Tax=Arthrobacter sp. NPDC080086 TaxID=3155917 RepID=UPI00344CE011